ncbi:MAG: damage-inducible protein DinB [Candidatus Solibacter sp.]|nr:damage-inducible protein DinB [Candidatus Solibacter sp.]
MPISQSLLCEFDREMGVTRKSLERVVDELWEYRPHEKSPTMGWLAGHLANIPNWAVMAISTASVDVATSPRTPKLANKAEVLYAFDTNVETAREAIEYASDECITGEWSLMQEGRTLMKMPRMAVLRNFVMNHMIHHRAQLGVYLRLNDIPVPAVYGPSADENNLFG